MFFLPDFYRAWCVQHVSWGDETHIKAITIDKGLMLDLAFFVCVSNMFKHVNLCRIDTHSLRDTSCTASEISATCLHLGLIYIYFITM